MIRFQRDCLQRIDNAFAEEVIVAGITLRGRCRKNEARTLRDCVRRRARLIVRRDLQVLLHLRGRHVNLIRIVVSEVAVLADDQRCNASRVGRRHRRALHITVGVAWRRAAGASALFNGVGRSGSGRVRPGARLLPPARVRTAGRGWRDATPRTMPVLRIR